MRIPLSHPTGILLAFLLAASLAVWAHPTTLLAQTKPSVDLETMIPLQVGEWSVDTSAMPLVASESAKRTLERIYNQTLSRTYIDRKGNRIMLALAYGSEQNDELKAHRPDVCYPAQGFVLSAKTEGAISTAYGKIPVTRLLTSKGNRIEPVTYWLAIGNYAASTDLKRKLIQLRYGLTGTVPDGMLVRVSSIDDQDRRAFMNQDEFIRQLVVVLSPQARYRISGLGLAEQ